MLAARLLWRGANGVARAQLGTAMLCAGLAALLSALAPLSLRSGIDAFPGGSPVAVWYGVGYAVALYGARMLSELAFFGYGFGEQGLQRRLSAELMRHVLKLPLSFHQ